MKKGLSLVLFIVVLLIITTLPAVGENAIIYETIVDREKISKGLEYEHKAVFTQAGWVDLHVLIMDMNQDQLGMEILRSSEAFGLRNTLTELADDYTSNHEGQVVAGVNGSFFNMSATTSDPLGISYDGDYVYADQGYNMQGKGAGSLIQLTDDSVLFDFFGISIQVTNEDHRSLFIDGINKLSVGDLPIIYNSLFSDTSEEVDKLGDFYKLVVVDDKVSQVATPDETVNIPDYENGYIIAVPKSIADIHLPFFPIGERLSLNIDSTLDTDNIKYAISGGGKILEDGQLVEDGFVVEPNVRHPRTAIGISGDGSTMVAMVVDGRGDSIGASHAELGKYLQAYGVTDAIHFDGGGSSTLIGRELGYNEVAVKNSPSGGSQRKVLNGIGFVSTAAVGKVAHIKIEATSQTVFKNNPIGLDVIGYDSNYNPVTIEKGQILWNMEGLKGTWETEAFTPTEAGNGVLTCYYKGLVTTINLKSLDEAIDLEVSPKILTMDYSETASFTLKGMDNNGYQGYINSKDATYTVYDKAIGAFIDGEFYSGSKTGLTKVKISVGDRWTTAYVVVGTEKTTLDRFKEADYYERGYPDTVLGSITKDESVKYDTDFSYRFDYNFLSSADPQAFYMMLKDFYINESTDLISLQVLGNNSGHMLRGKLIDAKGTSKTITFSEDINFNGWKELSVDVPDDMVFPVQLDRIYVVALQSVGPYTGTINIDHMQVKTRLATDDLVFDDEGFINDELRTEFPIDGYQLVSIFGATAYRNRLLDNILLEKVYSVMNKADYSIYAGRSDVDESRITNDYTLWDNTYKEYVVDDVRFVNLATNSGGIRATDYTQYDKITETLKNAGESTIVFIGNRDPFTNFTDDREGKLFHSILKDYYEKTGKTIIYIYGGGYETGVTIKDGIRYFDLSGLWYTIEDRYVSLNDTFYTLDFYVKNGQLAYRFKPLYPVVEIE